MQSFEQTLAAAADWNIPGGKYLFVLSTSQEIDLTFYGHGKKKLGKVAGVGQGFKAVFRGEKPISIMVESATAQTVKIAISDFGEIEYNVNAGAFTTSEVSPDTVTPLTDVSLTGTATTVIKAANADRAEIHIQNLIANSNTFRIGDSTAAAAKGIPLAPGATYILKTTAAVYGYNPGSAESVAVLEIERS